MKKISRYTKANYLRIGLSLCEIPCNDQTADLIIRLYEGILEKGHDFSIMDASKIEADIAKEYSKTKKSK